MTGCISILENAFPVKQASITLSLCLSVAGPLAAADAVPSSQPTTASAPAEAGGRIVEFQPGVRIDFGRRRVEVAATVIMREGAIELFACSPRIREHEAIVRIEARPAHVFQALGLIGLTPGHPTDYDAQTERLIPASGDPVSIDVQWERAGRTRREPIERWMLTAAGEPLTGELPWVFAGSIRNEDDSFAADGEGTVVAVVDFPTALIALSEAHTDSNEALWLRPNTERIPLVNTSCVLMIEPGPFRVTVDAKGALHLNGRPSSPEMLETEMARLRKDDPDRRINVHVHPDCPPRDREVAARLLRKLGLQADRASASQPAAASPSEGDAP